MDLEFKTVSFAEKEMIDRYAFRYGERSCQHSFVSMIGHSEKYGDAVYERAIDLLDNNMYSFTGSDFHRLSTFQRATKHLKLNSKRTDKLLKLFENNSTI